jgi:CDP-glucose 4,6-dehydratase
VAERPGALEGLGVSAAALPDRAFWAGKRVLVTGHTGFKGGWLTLWLREMGAEVTGFARAPDTDPSLFHLAQVERGITSLTGDLCDAAAVRRAIDKARPEIVIHLAAQAIVRRAIVAPAETFASNILGTAMLLEALRGREGLAAILVVTSDKVYANDGAGRAFREDDALGGSDPYSASKAAAELAVRAFGSSYFDAASIPLATARGGNIIGGGDFAPDRLVPDIVRAVRAGAKPALRHPDATRPWQHVLDCLAGYLLFVEALAAGKSVPRALNFGPEPGRPLTVRTLTEAVLGALGAGPAWDNAPEPGSLEMNSLTLDASAARRALGWGDRLAGGASVAWTAEWYRAFAGGADMRAATLRQIADYTGGAAGST